MGSHENEEGEKAECDFSDIDNIDGQLYTIQNVQTNEDGILKFEFNNNVPIEVRLVDEPRITFDCANEVCTSNDVVEAGSWTVEVKNGFYGDDGTFSNGMFDGEKWDTIPLIKTYFVDDKNYCEGAGGASGDHSEETTGSPRKKRSGWINPCSLKLDCPEGSSSQTVNGECQCVPTGSPTDMRKKRSTHMSSTTEMPLHAVLQLASLTASKFRSLACSLKLDCPEGTSSQPVDGDCQCLRTGSPRSRRSSSVDCGDHYAPSCEECIQGDGSESECNGDCWFIDAGWCSMRDPVHH